MTAHAKADDLIALTERLAAFVEQDIALLKEGRPAGLAANEGERTALAALYAKAVAEFKAKPAVMALPASTQKQLKQTTARLRKALRDQSRLLARFRHVTEGLIQAVAKTAAARDTAGVYGKAGQVVKPPADPRTAALTLNKAV